MFFIRADAGLHRTVFLSRTLAAVERLKREPDHDHSVSPDESRDAVALHALQRAMQMSKREGSNVICLSFTKAYTARSAERVLCLR